MHQLCKFLIGLPSLPNADELVIIWHAENLSKNSVYPYWRYFLHSPAIKNYYYDCALFVLRVMTSHTLTTTSGGIAGYGPFRSCRSEPQGCGECAEYCAAPEVVQIPTSPPSALTSRP